MSVILDYLISYSLDFLFFVFKKGKFLDKLAKLAIKRYSNIDYNKPVEKASYEAISLFSNRQLAKKMIAEKQIQYHRNTVNLITVKRTITYHVGIAV